MIEFFAGAAVMFVVGIVAAGVVFDMQADKIRSLEASRFALVEQITDLEARMHPFKWEMRADGMDAVIERGRDVSPRRQSVEPTGDVLVMPEIDDLPQPDRR